MLYGTYLRSGALKVFSEKPEGIDVFELESLPLPVGGGFSSSLTDPQDPLPDSKPSLSERVEELEQAFDALTEGQT